MILNQNSTASTLYVLNDEQMSKMLESFAMRAVELWQEAEEKRKPRYLSRKEVAELLGVTLPSVHRYVNEGILKPCYLNDKRKPLFIEQEVTQAIQRGVLGKYCRKEGYA